MVEGGRGVVRGEWRMGGGGGALASIRTTCQSTVDVLSLRGRDGDNDGKK